MKKFLLLLMVLFLLLTVCGCTATAPAEVDMPPDEAGITLEKCLKYGDYQWVEIEDLFVEDVLVKMPYEYELYDASELFAEVLENRNGMVIVERCIGFVINKETGDGRVLNALDENYNYISYRSVAEDYCDGTVFVSYMIYNPDNNYVDDIIERYDFVLSREWED